MRLLFAFLGFIGIAAAEEPLLLQKPTLNKSHVVFAYAGDLWRVPREGGEAVRLTSGAGIETDPVFSPDGTQIAFTGEYDGNSDVFVVPAAAVRGEVKIIFLPSGVQPTARSGAGCYVIGFFFRGESSAEKLATSKL